MSVFGEATYYLQDRIRNKLINQSLGTTDRHEAIR